MANSGNPQLENGYTRIANEILEALPRLKIPVECWRVLMVIFRKTYGYQKKFDRISLSQFCLATGMKKQNASRALKKLEKIGVIVIRGDDRKPKTYWFNKNYASWNLSSEEMTTKEKRNYTKEMSGKPDISFV